MPKLAKRIKYAVKATKKGETRSLSFAQSSNWHQAEKYALILLSKNLYEKVVNERQERIWICYHAQKKVQ